MALVTTCYAATAIYRSVGPSATLPVASGPAYTLSISGSTATFSGNLPANVGVGDAIQYDSDNGGTIDSICFIHGRTDAQHYTVKNAAGAAPTATSVADTDWVIFRAYTSLANAESGDENDSINDAVENFETWSSGKDLTSSDEQWNIACYANGTTADTGGAISGWTTDADNYLRIYTPTSSSEVGTSQRHSGKWDDNKYHMERDYDVFEIYNSYVKADGLQLRIIDKSGSVEGFRVNNAGYVWISNSIVKGAGPDSRWAVEIQSAVSDKIYVWNNIFYYVSWGIYDYSGAGVKVYAYNNTVVNARNGGIRTGSTSNMVAKNNITQGCPDGFNGTFDNASDYNLSDIAKDAPGTHSRNGATVTFMSVAKKDFHLSPSDTNALNYGIDLSSDPDLYFSDDIDIQARPSNAWDIGADELLISIYRSVGVGATSPVASGGSNALSISGSTATFASDLPNNVGVGDAIQYDSDNGGTIDSICFIHGRTDSTHYTVRKADGTAPTATSTGDNDWGIYRSYTSLYDAERGVENTGINDTVENFDTWSGGKDLVVAGQQWNIACYANGTTADTTAVTVYGWTTDSTRYIKIYTPTSASEVGVSQRHSGKLDTNKYYLTNSLTIREEYVKVDGLAMQITTTSTRGIFIDSSTGAGIIDISNTYVEQSGSASLHCYDIYNVGDLVINIWDSIGVLNETSTNKYVFYLNDADATLNCYNCTGIHSDGGTLYGSAFRQSEGTGNLVNCLGYSTSRYSFSGTWNSVTYSASDDDTADDWVGAGNRIDQTFSFVDLVGNDFHLLSTDTGAKDFGTTNPGSGLYSDDIDGQIRTGTWDIGADEMQKSVVRNAVIRNATVR